MPFGIAPHHVGILLVEGFSLMSYALVLQPLRAANQLAGEELYRCIHLSPDAAPVRFDDGPFISIDGGPDSDHRLDTLIVLMGGDPSSFECPKTLGWLRRLARQGVRIGGILAGPYLLARAGLLEGYRCTIHWELAPMFQERFPNALMEPSLYVFDRNRVTCAGGTAALDMIIDMIEREHGHELATRVSEWFVRTQPRFSEDTQRLSLRERYGINDDRVLKVLAQMETAIEEPVHRDVLVHISGTSPRHLDRLFRQHLDAGLAETYRRVRLDHAHVLLQRTGMSITDVALATGFQAVSHFSRSYRKQFGDVPRATRRRSR
jgi:transcriptional regulator GlxA family with amidase domain